MFCSPLINTLVYKNDYLNLCANFKKYMESELIQFEDSTKNYPIGLLRPNDSDLDPVKIHFVHDDDFKECKEKWDRRKKRIRYDKILYVYNLTCVKKEEDIREIAKLFNSINVKNKLIIKENLDIENSIYIPLDKNKFIDGMLTLPKNKKKYWERNIDDIGYHNFLNILKSNIFKLTYNISCTKTIF